MQRRFYCHPLNFLIPEAFARQPRFPAALGYADDSGRRHEKTGDFDREKIAQLKLGKPCGPGPPLVHAIKAFGAGDVGATPSFGQATLTPLTIDAKFFKCFNRA